MDKINTLYLRKETVLYLRSKGIEYVDELISLTLDELEENVWFIDINKIRCCLHDRGLILKGEYDGINLTVERLNTSINDLELINPVKKILVRSGIRTLGELLTTDYKTLLRLRGIGDYKMEVLRQFVHGLGCTLRNEYKYFNVNDKLKKLKQQGVRLLEDDLLDPKLYMLLYKNNIYTLEELKEMGVDVLEIPNYGPLRKKALIDRLKELGIQLVIESNDVDSLVENVRNENREIRERIESKQAMLLEYDELLRERAELRMREKELDQLIESKLKELGGMSYVKK